AADATTAAPPGAPFPSVRAGPAPVAVRPPAYRALRPGAPGPATLKSATAPGVRVAPPLLQYRLVLGADTLALDSVSMRAQRDGDLVTFTSAGAPKVTLR